MYLWTLHIFHAESTWVLQFCVKAWHYCSLASAITYPAVPLAYESVGRIWAQGQGPERILSSESIKMAGCGGGKQLSIARDI